MKKKGRRNPGASKHLYPVARHKVRHGKLSIEDRIRTDPIESISEEVEVSEDDLGVFIPKEAP